MRKHFWWITGVWMLWTTAAVAQESICIGVCLPLSGNRGEEGRLILEGIRAARSLKPQVLERYVELKVADTRSERAGAVNAVFRLVEKERVAAVIGGVNSVGQLESCSGAEKRGIPFVVPRSPLPVVASGHLSLGACAHDEKQGERDAMLALDHCQACTASIVYDMSDEQSIAMARGFQRKFTEAGGKIVSQARIKTGDRDFTGPLIHLRKAGPDIVYAPLYHVEAALLARQAQSMGLKIPTIVRNALHTPEVVEFGGATIKEVVYTQSPNGAMAPTNMGKALPDNLYAHREKRTMQTAQTIGADAYFSLIEAIARAGSTEPERIGKALFSLLSGGSLRELSQE
jgi:branched-chain amino acid transport system substrate-binding protein